MRRRLRRQRQMREALLLDLGALVFELNRHGRREPELLQAKAAELTAVDEEVRALAEALGSDQTLTQLVATGVAGSCENCGSLMSVDARYCSSCGAPAVPALSGEEPARAFHPRERIDDYAALATGPEAGYEYAPPEWADEPADESEPEPAAEEALAHEAEAEPEPEEPEEPEEPDEPEEPVAEEAADQDHAQEGVISVTPVPPREEEAEAETEVQEPAPTAKAYEGGQSPRALTDDAFDTAAKAIRTGIARGRAWIRARRTTE